jgi:nucleotide-binding universal stress UspA family protein
VRYGDPAAEITAAAAEYAAAAVIMATHGRTGLARSVLGSVAGGVLHRGSTPLLLLHPPELRGAEQPATEAPAIAGT